jgi:hypothetical protein
VNHNIDIKVIVDKDVSLLRLACVQIVKVEDIWANVDAPLDCFELKLELVVFSGS